MLRRERPLARAVRMKSCDRVSSMLLRVSWVRVAKGRMPRVRAGRMRFLRSRYSPVP